MYGLRRDGERIKTAKNIAEKAGANSARIDARFSLWNFMVSFVFLFLFWVQIIALIFTYARKISINAIYIRSMTLTQHKPLILTLSFQESDQAYFTDLRNKYFPSQLNYLQAHLTLFHQLPSQGALIVSRLKEIASMMPEMTLMVDKIVSIGNGTAFHIVSQELSTLHLALQGEWHDLLIPQDRQKLWPHVTVQNKVPLQQALRLQEQLSSGFIPFNVQGKGLTLWEYDGGPWNFLNYYGFQGS